jgi:hypothetical protein
VREECSLTGRSCSSRHTTQGITLAAPKNSGSNKACQCNRHEPWPPTLDGLARLYIYGAHQLQICCTCTFARRIALFFPHYPRFCFPLLSSSIPLMSHTHHTSTSPNFQLVFDNALKAYGKCTKNDLLTHQLANRLEPCDSASSILTVLQELVQELNESQRSNAKWLDPTVNVLLAFSKTLGEGVGSVCFRTRTWSEIYRLIFI